MQSTHDFVIYCRFTASLQKDNNNMNFHNLLPSQSHSDRVPSHFALVLLLQVDKIVMKCGATPGVTRGEPSDARTVVHCNLLSMTSAQGVEETSSVWSSSGLSGSRLEAKGSQVLLICPVFVNSADTGQLQCQWQHSTLAGHHQVLLDQTPETTVKYSGNQLPYHSHDTTEAFFTASMPGDSVSVKSSVVRCKHCSSDVPSEALREHVAAHCIKYMAAIPPNPSVRHMCGFCGGDRCTPELSANGQAAPSSCIDDCWVQTSAKPCQKDRSATTTQCDALQTSAQCCGGSMR